MKTKLFVFVSLFVITAFTNLNCIDYYVSPSGDDNNTGTELLPFKTIQKAADVAVGGDNIYIKEGVYNEHVILKNTKPDLLIIRSNPGDTAIIDGTGFDVYWSGIVDIVGQQNIHIEGLRVINSNGTGFWCDSSRNITIIANSTYNTASSGIAAWNSNSIIIYRNKIDNACSNMSQECLTVAGCDSFETRDNSVSKCYKEGMCFKDGSRNGEVERNIVYDVINKLGIYVDAWDKHTFNINVYNNVVHNCNSGVVLASEMGGLLDNICSNNLSFQIAHEGINPSNMEIDHNLIWGFRDYPDEERGTDYVEADPMFTDTTAKNFHIILGSPAIDAGSPTDAPIFDFEYNLRPYGNGFDIGAYEYYPIGAVEIENDETNIEISPNPFSDFCVIKTEAFADIEIFDSFGRSIIKAKGQIVWEPDFNLSEGVYFVSGRFNNKTLTKPLIFLK